MDGRRSPMEPEPSAPVPGEGRRVARGAPPATTAAPSGDALGAGASADGATSDLGVRRSAEADLDAVVEVLVSSHLDYRWEVWALPDDGTRRWRLEQLYRASVALVALPWGEVWQTSDGTAAAAWVPTDAFDRLDAESGTALGGAVGQALGDRAEVVSEVDAEIERARPAADWFLATMGTAAALRRQGRGAAVLRPRLAALDAAGHRAVADTSDPANVDFYRRFGFEVAAVLDALPHGAPPTWVLHRPPQR